MTRARSTVRGLRSVNTSFNLIAPVTFDEEGRLVDLGLAAGDPRFTRFHLGPGTAVDTVPVSTAEEQALGFSRSTSWWETSPPPSSSPSPSGPAGFTGTGREVGGRRRPVPRIGSPCTIPTEVRPESRTRCGGPALTADERERAQAQIDGEKERFDLREHPWGIPDRKPVLAELFFDRAGRLWVERTGVEGEEMREADVYREGALVARYRWPRRVSHLGSPWVTETALYGTTRDSLDVWRAARVRFARVP